MKRLTLLIAMLTFFASTALGADVLLLNDETPDSLCATAVQLRFAERVVLIGDESCTGAAGELLAADVDVRALYLVRDKRPAAARLGYFPLYETAGWQLAWVENAGELAAHPDVMLTPANESRTVVFALDGKKVEPDPLIEELLGQLDATSYTALLTELTTFPTRYACTQSYLDAKDAVAAHFTELGLDVEQMQFNNHCYMCEGAQGFNVIAKKVGSVRPDDWYMVGAHLDSTSQNPCTNSQGANDNGSGSAAVMELARLFADVDTEGTILFVTFGGEELGLFGSTAMARMMDNNGLIDKLKGFVVLDMISFHADTWGGYLEGSKRTPEQKQAVYTIGAMGQTYTDLVMTGQFSAMGSDHVPFLNKGVPGALLIETDWSHDSAYHTVNDTLDRQDITYAVEMTKVAAASLATWATIIPPAVDDDDDDITDDDDDATPPADDDTTDDDTSDDDDDATDDDDDDDDDDGCGC
ncbi:MAG TPA: M28 family metallopeptidase [bacterium]|nr:M28 family metallopeptidase [bacterium]